MCEAAVVPHTSSNNLVNPMPTSVLYLSRPHSLDDISTMAQTDSRNLCNMLLQIRLLLSFVLVATPAIATSFSIKQRPFSFVSSPSFSSRHNRPSSFLKMSSSEKGSPVVVVGSANQDLTTYTGILPQMGETVMGTKFQTSCGGKGANQAVAAAKLDMAPVSMICRVGDDQFGKALLSNFREAHVQYDESSTVLADKDISTGVAPIVVDTSSGDNMIIVIPGANHALTPTDARQSISSLLQGNDFSPPPAVVVQLEIKPETALEALKTGKEMGATTILNTAPAPDGWTLDDFYPFIDILIPNETELASICSGMDGDEEDMARSLLAKGVGTAVVVTLGSRGAMIVAKSGSDSTTVTLVDAPSELPCRKDPVVDTIGAGDVFCGALATYLSSGLDLVEASRMACGVASMTVRKQGAQTSYPTASELPDCLKIS